MPPMKLALNIGCGVADHRDSTAEIKWVNLDANPAVRCDVRHPIARLAEFFQDVDLIEANDILEHVPVGVWEQCLREWIACLRSGGTIRVQVPAPEAVWARFQDQTLDEAGLNRVIYGENTGQYDRHYQLISQQRLEAAVRDAGLEILESRILNICAIVVARKP